MVVDDDDAVCEGLKVVLEMDNYDVVTNHDAAMAVEAVKATPPGLIIIDFNMPGLNGTRATEIIRAIPSSLPIIGISAEAHREAEMLDAGVSAFLAKPLDMKNLTLTIGRLLKDGATV